MPTLNWIGKDKVINHHLSVPYKVLNHLYGYCDGKRIFGETGLGNMIIHGDNLSALKSLLPQFEGKVKCIYIDPPYNTGNESWIYNDNVSDPKIRKWLNTVVGKEGEDLSRHDKWLCMMYPRLKLLHKLLHKDGFIAISIDDNEVFNLGLVMNEIFGANKRLACIPVKAEPSGGKGKDALRVGHEYLLVYCKDSSAGLKLETRQVVGAELADKKGNYIKGRELSKWGSESLREDREEMWFPLEAPDGSEVYPIRNDGKEGRWRWGKRNQKMIDILKDPNSAHWEMRKFDEGVEVGGKKERWFPFEKIRIKEKSFGWNTWLDTIGYNSEGTKQIKQLFSNKIFDTPKPTSLIEWVVNLMSDSDGIVLDSFVGSGSTGQAVLNLNFQDGGNRRFVLIEMEDYAEKITAERLRKVILGYSEIEGTGGGFDFYTLGEDLFDEDDNLNEAIELKKIRSYVYYSETKKILPEEKNIDNRYFLSKNDSTAYYFYYEKERPTILSHEFLATIRTKAEQYIIYADNCLLAKEFMAKNQIIFKKIPRDITRF